MVAVIGITSAALLGGSGGSVGTADKLVFHRTELAHSTAEIAALAFSQDGSVVAAVDQPGQVRIWDTASVDGRFHLVRSFKVRHSGAITAIAVSDDGLTIATADNKQRISVTDADTKSLQFLVYGSLGRIVSLTFPTNETVTALTVDQAGSVRFHKISLLDRKQTLSEAVTPDLQSFTTAAITRDGAYVATLRGGGQVQLWMIRDGTNSAFEGHRWDTTIPRSVKTIAIDSHATRLTTIDREGIARVWSLTGEGAKSLGNLRGSSHIGVAAMSPSGDSILTAGAKGRLEMWSAGPGHG